MLKTICVARLRERTRYTRPLDHILSYFYDLLSNFIKRDKDFKWTYYNVTFDGSVPFRNLAALKQADVVIVPTEQEFHYHVPNYFHTIQMRRSHEFVRQIAECIEDKRIVLLRSDRADDETLYRNYTFSDVKNLEFRTLDEADFPGGFTGLNYLYLKALLSESLLTTTEKKFDFIYWGSGKERLPGGARSQDSRHLILRKLKKSHLQTYFIGRFTGFKADERMQSMRAIAPILARARATICFNWIDQSATTARYHEALALGVIPLVFQNYDQNNTLVCDQWQRVWSHQDAIDKIHALRHPVEYTRRFSVVEAAYPKLTRAHYQSRFDELLTRHLS